MVVIGLRYKIHEHRIAHEFCVDSRCKYITKYKSSYEFLHYTTSRWYEEILNARH